MGVITGSEYGIGRADCSPRVRPCARCKGSGFIEYRKRGSVTSNSCGTCVRRGVVMVSNVAGILRVEHVPDFEYGLYKAVFDKYEQRFAGDNCAHARWLIHRAEVLVGKMFDGPVYGWGRPHCSLSKLVWSGDMPPGCCDSRSVNYGMHFDVGPQESYEDALRIFAARADRLIAWRRGVGLTREQVEGLRALVDGDGALAFAMRVDCFEIFKSMTDLVVRDDSGLWSATEEGIRTLRLLDRV